MAGNPSAHHKLHHLTGWGVIIGLPFAIMDAINAVSYIAERGNAGFVDWFSTPLGSGGFLAFFLAAIWYCKLELDEVFMDYFSGKLRSTTLLFNRLVATLIFILVAFAIIKMASS